MSAQGTKQAPNTGPDYGSADLYARLGLEPDATEDEIREAYKKALKYVHPDLRSELSAEERARYDDLMKGVNEARDTLLDPQRRARYNLRRRDQRKAGANPGTRQRNAQSPASGSRGYSPSGGASGRSDDHRRGQSASGSTDTGSSNRSGHSRSDAGSDRERWEASQHYERASADGAAEGAADDSGERARHHQAWTASGPTVGASAGRGSTGSRSRTQAGQSGGETGRRAESFGPEAGSRRRFSFTRSSAEAFRAREARYAAARAAEERARQHTLNAADGEYGPLARWLYSRSVGLHQLIACILGAWLYYMALTVLGTYASWNAAAAFMVGTPLVAIIVHRIWRRLSGRVFGLPPGEWAGIAPYNAKWWLRTAVEAAYLGPLLGMAAMLLLGTLPSSDPARTVLSNAWFGVGVAALLLIMVWVGVGFYIPRKEAVGQAADGEHSG